METIFGIFYLLVGIGVAVSSSTFHGLYKSVLYGTLWPISFGFAIVISIESYEDKEIE